MRRGIWVDALRRRIAAAAAATTPISAWVLIKKPLIQSTTSLTILSSFWQDFQAVRPRFPQSSHTTLKRRLQMPGLKR